MADSLVGKTIARVARPPYDEYGESGLLVMWFTDGTAAKLRGAGYEVDDVEVEPTTAAELDAELVAHIEDQIDLEWSRHEAAVRKHWECIQMAEAYGGEDTHGYQQWYQNRFGSIFGRAFKDGYVRSIRDMIAQSNRQTYGSTIDFSGQEMDS